MATRTTLPRVPATADSLFECVEAPPECLYNSMLSDPTLPIVVREEVCEMERYSHAMFSVSVLSFKGRTNTY